ncbi:lytic transglycosylase domain-containing protein [Agrobacterium vitis]|uniref:lytic transglycosylase domain-containing protein n=1 Tax=Allorhizobium ampelinum TaxID=3025782 RepID=UPI001F2B29D7|nr:lytic transglycosylase domain-containing protein [Allorhizobium ampelinum]MCF1450521.1 lytic transglycosylase domain-containing protein [Allorhizobium ampelinum]
MRLNRCFALLLISTGVSSPVPAQVPVIDAENLAEKETRDSKTTNIKSTQSDAHTMHSSVSCSVYRKGKSSDPASAANANSEIAGLVKRVAQEEGVDENLFLSLVYQESRFNPCAQSPVGAYGLSQLMPGTAAGLGVNPHNIEDNLRGGARYLKQQLRTFNGDTSLALAAYNAGPGNVKKYGGIPPFKETQGYVAAITQKWMPAFGGSSSTIPVNYGGGGEAVSTMRNNTVTSLAATQATSESTGNVSSWYQQLGSTYAGTIQDSWDQNSGVRNANAEMSNKLIELSSIFAQLFNDRNTLSISSISGAFQTTKQKTTQSKGSDQDACEDDEGYEWDAELAACVRQIDSADTLVLQTTPQ